MPDEVGPPNGVATPNFSLRRIHQPRVAGGKARAHLAEGAGARLRGDAVEDDARGLALAVAPVRRRARRPDWPASAG